jgi:carbamoyl-phosphate synthase large subunit
VTPELKKYASYKMVDTCAAEFAAETPYFYSTFDAENEAEQFLAHHSGGKKKVLVIVPARSASGRGSSSTIVRCTASGR